MMMDKTAQRQIEKCPPWEDWEDHGGFDDEEALMGKLTSKSPVLFQERPWYYEKQKNRNPHPITVCIQLSFL